RHSLRPIFTLTGIEPNPRASSPNRTRISADCFDPRLTKCHPAAPGYLQTFARTGYSARGVLRGARDMPRSAHEMLTANPEPPDHRQHAVHLQAAAMPRADNGGGAHPDFPRHLLPGEPTGRSLPVESGVERPGIEARRGPQVRPGMRVWSARQWMSGFHQVNKPLGLFFQTHMWSPHVFSTSTWPSGMPMTL